MNREVILTSQLAYKYSDCDVVRRSHLLSLMGCKVNPWRQPRPADIRSFPTTASRRHGIANSTVLRFTGSSSLSSSDPLLRRPHHPIPPSRCVPGQCSSAYQGDFSSPPLPRASTPPLPPKSPSFASRTCPRPILATFVSLSSTDPLRGMPYLVPFSRRFEARLMMFTHNMTRRRARSSQPAAGTSDLAASRVQMKKVPRGR